MVALDVKEPWSIICLVPGTIIVLLLVVLPSTDCCCKVKGLIWTGEVAAVVAEIRTGGTGRADRTLIVVDATAI